MPNQFNTCVGLQCYNNNNTNSDFSEYCPDFDIYPTIIPHKERVVAIGDIHGDMNKAIDFLKVAKVIEEINPSTLMKREIIEHKYNIIFKGDYNKIERLNHINIKKSYKNIDDSMKNQIEIAYRYYEINNDNYSEYFVKIVQEDNNPRLYNDTKSNNRWFKWIGGETYIVQVGDQVDRCRPYDDVVCRNRGSTINDEDSDLEIMLFYDSLDKIAKKKGGRVYSLLGNHEIMNVMGDMRYVSHKGLREFSPTPKNVDNGEDMRIQLFNTKIARKMACTRSTVLAIGDYLFVHGGIADKLAYKYNLLQINNIIRNYLHGTTQYHYELKQLLNSSKFSPLWYRKLAYIPPDENGKKHYDCKAVFDPVIDEINKKNFVTNISSDPIIQIKGMVIGHTPQFTVFGKGITTACDNRLIRADIGASSAFDVFSDEIKSKYPNIDIHKARMPQVVEILTDLKTKESIVKILPFD